MAFDPDAYLASKTQASQTGTGFNPDAYLQAKSEGRSPSQFPVSTLGKDRGVINEGMPTQGQTPQKSFGEEVLDRAQTQLESFGNTVTMGYLPHIQAAFEKIGPNPTAYTDEKLRSEGFVIPEEKYVGMRDQNIKRQEDQAKRNPYDSAAGMISGMAVTAPIMAAGQTALNAGKAAVGGFARLKDSARLGATLGLVANPGDTEGVVAPLQATERLEGSAKGGALGGAGQGVGEGVSKLNTVARKAPEALEKLAKNSAFKAAGAMLKDFRAAFGRNSTDEIGETLINKNIVAAGDTLDDIVRKAGEAKEETGKAIGTIYKQVEDTISQASANNSLSRADKLRLKASALDGKKIADSAAGLIQKKGKSTLGGSKIISSVQDKLDDLSSRKDLTIKDMIEFKSGIDADINYSKQMKELPEVQQQLKHLRDVINKKIQDRVRVAGKIVKDESLITGLKQANKEYGHLSTTVRTATDKINRTDANNFFSLGDKIAGVGLGAGEIARADTPEDAAKAILKGFIVAGSSKLGRTYGPSALSATSKYFAKQMEKPANLAKFGKPLMEAAKRSPEEFQALLNQFGKQPEFKSLYQAQGAR